MAAVAVNAKKDKKKEKDGKDKPSNTLFLRELPRNATSDEIIGFFSKVAPVRHAVAVTEHGSDRGRGFGFVTFTEHSDAIKAIKQLNKTPFRKKFSPLTMEVARHRQRMEKKVEDDNDDRSEGDSEEDIVEAEEEEDGKVIEVAEQKTIEAAPLITEDNASEADFLALDEAESDGEPAEEEEIEYSDKATTIFVRNLPYFADADDLTTLFSTFGPVKYALVVKDPKTQKSKGSAFVRFKTPTIAEECLRLAKKVPEETKRSAMVADAVLDEAWTRFLLKGRVLSVHSTVAREEVAELNTQREAERKKERGSGLDKRNLYLLDEGVITNDSGLYKELNAADIQSRDDSYEQRRKVLEVNYNLHISLTRLSIRNLPREITSKALKSLCTHAVVQFATEVKEFKRAPLTKEEKNKTADVRAVKKGMGVVRQAKVVTEDKANDKTTSRGYAFAEFRAHKHALMALRWLNGRTIGLKDIPGVDVSSESITAAPSKAKRRRLIVEFALENVNVVQRRAEKEQRMKEAAARKRALEAKDSEEVPVVTRVRIGDNDAPPSSSTQKPRKSNKRKRKPTDRNDRPSKSKVLKV